MPKLSKPVVVLSPEEKLRKKRYLSAMLVTCISLVMILGSLHVARLGSMRMGEMRALATYDLKEESSRIRAQGEDIVLHEQNEKRKNEAAAYTLAEAETLLTKNQWDELDSMVKIPAGNFLMGSNLKNADASSHPEHGVKLKAYQTDKYLVTNAQYARFVAATRYRPPLDWKSGKIEPGTLMYPVTMVNWYDAAAYCKWAGRRLPTEAEWEKAARGTDGRRWPWGNQMDPKRLNTYYDVGSATDVTTYSNGVSPYGVYDMAGNVDEWTADDFLPYQGTDAAANVFQGKVSKVLSAEDQAMKVSDLVRVNRHYKVLRGGSWKGDPFSTETYHRDYAWPNSASNFYGFRCASDAQK